ncbi:MAG: chemotaxis protein CheW [Burkholderiaceae bacterium]
MDERIHHTSLVCRVHTRLCALPLLNVLETLRPLPIEPLVDAPAHVLGLARIRGQSLPVIDLAGLLGIDGIAARRFVTVVVGRRRAALAVGEVLGLRELPPGEAEALPPLLKEGRNEPIKAIARLDAELLMVLNGARLLPDEIKATP